MSSVYTYRDNGKRKRKGAPCQVAWRRAFDLAAKFQHALLESIAKIKYCHLLSLYLLKAYLWILLCIPHSVWFELVSKPHFVLNHIFPFYIWIICTLSPFPPSINTDTHYHYIFPQSYIVWYTPFPLTCTRKTYLTQFPNPNSHYGIYNHPYIITYGIIPRQVLSALHAVLYFWQCDSSRATIDQIIILMHNLDAIFVSLFIAGVQVKNK